MINYSHRGLFEDVAVFVSVVYLFNLVDAMATVISMGSASGAFNKYTHRRIKKNALHVIKLFAHICSNIGANAMHIHKNSLFCPLISRPISHGFLLMMMPHKKSDRVVGWNKEWYRKQRNASLHSSPYASIPKAHSDYAIILCCCFRPLLYRCDWWTSTHTSVNNAHLRIVALRKLFIISNGPHTKNQPPEALRGMLLQKLHTKIHRIIFMLNFPAAFFFWAMTMRRTWFCFLYFVYVISWLMWLFGTTEACFASDARWIAC